MFELYKLFYEIVKNPEIYTKAIVLTESQLLREMLRQVFIQRGYKFKEDGQFLFLEQVNFLEVLRAVKDELSLSSPALQDILAVSVPLQDNFSLKHVSQLKPLVSWYSILDALEDLNVITEERLSVYFQPVVDRNAVVLGHECLIRGVRADGTIVSPANLLDLAIKTGNIFHFDRLCRETCVKAVAKAGLRDKLVFINFIPTSIYDPATCLQTTISWVYSLGLRPENIIFEVVESQKVEDLKHLSEILNTYREGGFKVALDDVGTGYASLELLVLLKPDIIKIDREIVRLVHGDPLKKSLINALVQISRENGIKVLAEGVEHREDFEYLRDKVDYFQGYYFSKPQPKPVEVVQLN
ncbi:MAG: EAL domain-containing protein [Caldimicrobium sp.]|nr:EAL domain-containing protein [Caldimicrobium sp.]